MNCFMWVFTLAVCGQPNVMGWTIHGECCDGAFRPVYVHREIYARGDLKQFRVVQNSARLAAQAPFVIPWCGKCPTQLLGCNCVAAECNSCRKL